jgi:hypothetical protein
MRDIIVIFWFYQERADTLLYKVKSEDSQTVTLKSLLW